MKEPHFSTLQVVFLTRSRDQQQLVRRKSSRLAIFAEFFNDFLHQRRYFDLLPTQDASGKTKDYRDH